MMTETMRTKHMATLLTTPILALLLMAAQCNTSKVPMYVNLAVDATVNGLTLAQSFGAQIPPGVADEVKHDGDLVKSAVADWVAASADQQPGKWAEVQKDLDIFKSRLPEILQAVHVDNPAYGAITSLAITAVEQVVSIIQNMNPAVSQPAAKVAALDTGKFKADYNRQMIQAGHPELSLK